MQFVFRPSDESKVTRLPDESISTSMPLFWRKALPVAIKPFAILTLLVSERLLLWRSWSLWARDHLVWIPRQLFVSHVASLAARRAT